MTVKPEDGSSLHRLVEVMRRLLAPGGCPWDREQTFTSLKRYALEEAYEVCEAIDELGPDAERPVVDPTVTLGPADPAVAALREELGDLLLQVVFQAELARHRRWFGPDDVVDAICEKLVRRHPHVFGDVTVSGTGEVLANWEKLKQAEKRDRGALDGIPRGLPALLYALRMGDKASRVGFDWPDPRGPRAKVDEELGELDQAIAEGDRGRMLDELGDVLFSLVNLARKLDLDPEDALVRTNRRFTRRFRAVEDRARQDGRALDEHSLAELDALWNQVKAAE